MTKKKYIPPKDEDREALIEAWIAEHGITYCPKFVVQEN